jgi:hypothetical protein
METLRNKSNKDKVKVPLKDQKRFAAWDSAISKFVREVIKK